MAGVGRGSNRDSKIGGHQHDISHHTIVGQTEFTFGFRTEKDEQGKVVAILKDGDGKPIKRPLYYNHVQTQDISTTMFEAAGSWSEQASVTMDGLFVPYGGVFASGEINRKIPHAGVGGPSWNNGQRTAFTPFEFLEGNGTESGEANEWGYDANLVAGKLPTREWPPEQIAGRPLDYKRINSLTLNPFNYGNNIQGYHKGKDIADPENAGDFDASFDYSAIKTGSLKQKGYDPRAIGFRAPMMIVGWGYDTSGKPVPNADYDADPTIYDAAGEIIPPEASGSDEFLPDYQWRMDKWKAGPLDVRWDREKKTWTAGGAMEINLLQAARCFNYVGWEAPYDACVDGNPQCCFTDESGMGVPEPPFYGGTTAEFQTCCPGSNCRSKQCATNYWTCDSCDNTSICVAKADSPALSKTSGAGTRIHVDDVSCLYKAITGLGMCTGAPQHRTRQDCDAAGLIWVPNQGNTIHIKVSQDLDEAFAGNPSLRPSLPNLGGGGGTGSGGSVANFNGVETVKVSDVQFDDPKCVAAKCPGYLEIAPDTGLPAQNRGLSAPSWQGCAQSESNPCMPQGQTCGGGIDDEGMRARGCPSVWTPPFYVIGPGLAFHDAIEIRKSVEAPNGYSTDSPPDWEAGHKETPTTVSINKAVVENVMLHSLKRSQFFYGLNTGRVKRSLVDVRAGSDPEDCSQDGGTCGTTGASGCCCENVGDPGHVPDNDAAYGTGCEPVEVFENHPVYWIMQAEFEYKNVATKVTCDPDTFEITVCTRKIPVEGGSSCEYCPGFTTCLSGDETSGVGNLY
jgi:hypothetical protein